LSRTGNTFDLTGADNEGSAQFTYTQQDVTVISGRLSFADVVMPGAARRTSGESGHVLCLASGFVVSTAAS
jgi:hypothetical protein